MPRYSVNVCRTAYGNLNITVEAKNKNEAEVKALNTAGNYVFNEHTSEYTAEGVTKV